MPTWDEPDKANHYAPHWKYAHRAARAGMGANQPLAASAEEAAQAFGAPEFRNQPLHPVRSFYSAVGANQRRASTRSVA